MIVGDPGRFAIESEITYAYERPGQLALGFFVIHVTGRCYGVKDWDASMLANAYDMIGERIANRGSYAAPFPMDASAAEIAFAFRRAVYDETKEDERFFGLSATEFGTRINRDAIDWTTSLDEAFDDGSYSLQFEQGDEVRVVAFMSTQDFSYDPASLRDVRMSADEFYEILREWHDRFRGEWKRLPKVSGHIQ